MEISEKILEIRKILGLSQEKIAEKLNVSRQTVSNWENNRTQPKAEIYMSIIKLLDN